MTEGGREKGRRGREPRRSPYDEPAEGIRVRHDFPPEKGNFPSPPCPPPSPPSPRLCFETRVTRPRVATRLVGSVRARARAEEATGTDRAAVSPRSDFPAFPQVCGTIDSRLTIACPPPTSSFSSAFSSSVESACIFLRGDGKTKGEKISIATQYRSLFADYRRGGAYCQKMCVCMFLRRREGKRDQAISGTVKYADAWINIEATICYYYRVAARAYF